MTDTTSSTGRPSREFAPRQNRGIFGGTSRRSTDAPRRSTDKSRRSHDRQHPPRGSMDSRMLSAAAKGQRPAADSVNLSASGLPAVRMSTIGNVILPSTFRFEPIEDSPGGGNFNQAGGHDGAFKMKGPLLEKTVTDREARFYENALKGAWPTQFLPKYDGRTEDGTGIRIENLTHNLKAPCVMDLKMGFQSVEASETSRLKKMKHAALDKVTGSKQSGVRLEGMSLHRTLEKRRMRGTKAQSHSVSAHKGVSLQDVLTFFLSDKSGVRTDIALRFQAHIEALLHFFKKYNNKHLFIGSSILLIYDNDNSAPHMRWARALQRVHSLSGGKPISPDSLAALTRRTPVDVRMIDFAHVGKLPIGQARDFGYIQGLQTILVALKAIRAHRSAPIFSVAGAALDAQSEQAKVEGNRNEEVHVSNESDDSLESINSNAENMDELTGQPPSDPSKAAPTLSGRTSVEFSGRPSNEISRPSADFASRVSRDSSARPSPALSSRSSKGSSARPSPALSSRTSRDSSTRPSPLLCGRSSKDSRHRPSISLGRSSVERSDGSRRSNDRSNLCHKSSDRRTGHIVTFMDQKAPDGVCLSASGLPAVRLSSAGNRVLPSTFRFEPADDSQSSSFDQAGGHEGAFKVKGPVLEKLVTDREASFYELAQAGKWPMQFLPKYHGRTDDGKGIHIENLTHKFQRPCVMDLKMGFNTVESTETSRVKKMKHAALDKVTGSKHSGVRLEGMSLYRTLEKRRMKGTKAQSHTVSASMGVSLQDVLTFFLTDESGVRTDIALRFQAHIESLLYHFKKYNNKHLFIGSSVLLMYDNDNSAPHMRWARALQRVHSISGGTPMAPDTLAGLTRRTMVDVRMIDFAHVGALPLGQARDFGYIQGLQTILAALKAIRSHRSKPIFSVASAALDAQAEQARIANGVDQPPIENEDSTFNFGALYEQCDSIASNSEKADSSGRASDDFSSRSSSESSSRPSLAVTRAVSESASTGRRKKLHLPRTSSDSRGGHIVTFMDQKAPDGVSLSASGLPAVRLSSAGNRVLPSTFRFEPVEDSHSTSFDQAGGHDGAFKVKGPILEKSVTDREASFYELAEAGKWPMQFLPKYHGRTKDGSGIHIENLTHNFERPCVMDLKMGFQSVESSETSRVKKMKHAALDKVTGSKHSGVRLEGMSLYRTLEKRRMKGTKAQSHTVSAHLGVSLQDVLTFFLTDESGVRTDIALRFQAHIEALLYHFKKYNNKHLFIGSSVLLIYDNDNSAAHMRWARALQRVHSLSGGTPMAPDTLAGLTRRTMVDVRMIDFAHVGALPLGQARDFGYIQGLQTILAALKAIRAHRTRPIFSVASAALDAQAEQARLSASSADGSNPRSSQDSALETSTVTDEDEGAPAFTFDNLYEQCSPEKGAVPGT